ncbi:MAG: ATP-binding cassette domain-containing protein [Oscillospiraceae bacterium]|jgi:zinc transport system ATP-binding protein|nr:ATP-binding cassette domain-containing protein [Oscillospiraceae bacterium]
MLKKCQCSVKIENLSVFDNNRLILKSITFDANHGEILALLGRNGSGKTTILKALLNCIQYIGKIIFFNSRGQKIKNPKIGYVPQKLVFEKNSPLTVADFFCTNLTNFPIWLGKTKRTIEKINNILNKFEISYLANERLGRLSEGELQRVLLAFALEPVPDILILDEPSSSLDTKGIDFFYSLITKVRSEFHMPIVLVSHDLIHIKRYATKYVLIENGTLIEILPISNLAESSNAKKIFNSIFN